MARITTRRTSRIYPCALGARAFARAPGRGFACAWLRCRRRRALWHCERPELDAAPVSGPFKHARFRTGSGAAILLAICKELA